MAKRDQNTLTGYDDGDDSDSVFEEYDPADEQEKDGDADAGGGEGLVDKFNNLSTGQKVAVGAAGVAAVGAVAAAGVGIHNAVKKDDDDRPEWEKNAPVREEKEEKTRSAG